MALPTIGQLPASAQTVTPAGQSGGAAADQAQNPAEPAASPASQLQASNPAEGTPSPAAPAFNQEQVNKMIAAERRKVEAELKRKADEQAAEAAGQWQTLAEQRAAEVASLRTASETTQAQLTTALALIEAEAERRIKALPAEIRAMKPEGDAIAIYSWLPKAETAASKLAGQPATPPAGTPAGPRGAGSAPSQAISASELIMRKRASGDYDV